jgi:hypothetical protein
MERFIEPTEEFFNFSLIMCLSYIYLLGIYYSHRKENQELRDKEDLRKIDLEKNRIAIEMHDDLGADLSNLLFKLRMYQIKNKDKNIDEFHQVENFTKEIIKKVNETIWTLNSAKDTLNSLVNFMLKFMDEFLVNSDTKYQFQYNKDLPEIYIPIEKRRHIFHLFKDTIKSLVWADDISKLNVDFKYLDKFIYLIINVELKNKNELKNHVFVQSESSIQRIKFLKAEFKEIDKSGYEKEIIYKIDT